MATDPHPLSQIKTMRGEALDARIQLQPLAAFRAGELANPVKHLLAQPLRPRALIRHQVVHITKASPKQTGHDPKTRRGGDLALASDECEAITLCQLLSNGRHKFFLLQIPAQLEHARPAIPNVGVSLGEYYGHNVCGASVVKRLWEDRKSTAFP